MKNGKPLDVEARLERLEAEVKEMKSLLDAKQEPNRQWWKEMIGVFANDPVAEEVRRIVEENREKERRQARRRPAKRKKHRAGASS